MRILLTAALLFGAAACAANKTQPDLDSRVWFERSLHFEVTGCDLNRKCDESSKRDLYGVGVAVNAPLYRIKVYEPENGNIDLLTITTCHRNLRFKGSDAVRFFRNNAIYWYEPSPLEASRSCQMDIGVYSDSGDSTPFEFGLLDFEDRRAELKSNIYCDGKEAKSVNGVYICQGAVSTIQRIIFASKVDYEATGCNFSPDVYEDKVFTWKMPEEHDCVIWFMEKSEPHKAFRLVLYSYDQIAISRTLESSSRAKETKK